MAGKKNRQLKGKLYVERFAYDVLFLMLRLCGLPKELLKSKERGKNHYEVSNQICKDILIVLNVALSMRDEWNIMFESRFKSSGIGMIEKIDDFLKNFLSIRREFQQGNTITKTRVSLAAYSEMILFLNYKGIEFDFEQMIVSWTTHFYERIAEQSKSNSLQDLFHAPSDPPKFIKWVKSFMKDVAAPYGCRNDVSNIFRQYLEKQKQIKNEETLEKQKIYAHFASQTTTLVAAGEYDPILPPGFESPTDLPGNRESPEPPEVLGKDKKSKRRSTGPVVPSDFESLADLLGVSKSPEAKETHSTKIGARGKDKKSKRRTARPVVTSDLESLAVLPNDTKSPETKDIRSTKMFARIADKKSQKRSVGQVVPPDLDTLTVCPGKRESSEPTECLTKSGVRGKDKESTRPSTRSTDITLGRRKQSTEQVLEEGLRQMSLSNKEK